MNSDEQTNPSMLLITNLPPWQHQPQLRCRATFKNRDRMMEFLDDRLTPDPERERDNCIHLYLTRAQIAMCRQSGIKVEELDPKAV